MKGRIGVLKTQQVVTRGGRKEVTEREAFAGKAVRGEALSNVGFSVGFTRGLPNYSSIRIDVSCHLPCPVGQEAPTFVHAQSFAVRRLREAIRDVMGDLEKEMR